MINSCVPIEYEPNRSLQIQIKEYLVQAIINGAFIDKKPLPSCRSLAKQFGVSRNTIAIVYEQLIDENFVISKQRRGYYLTKNYLYSNEYVIPSSIQNNNQKMVEYAPQWQNRLKKVATDYMGTLKPSNWSQFEYPFIYGQIDTNYFPLAQWRLAAKQFITGSRDKTWLTDYIDRDDSFLIEQIRTRVLPKRGILAKPEQILMTLGSQNALFLIANLLFDDKTSFAIETPGYIDAFNIVKIHHANIIHQPIDNNGIVLSESLKQANYIYVTPNHQVPTGVMMSKERKAELLQQAILLDQIIIEDDYDAEIDFTSQARPSLKALDHSDRVIYISSFSKILSPGLRIGYMVANEDFIDECKALRRLMYRHPPANIQCQLAQFISQGYYDRYLNKYNAEVKQRWDIMNTSIDRFIPQCKINNATYASSFWLQSSNESQRLCWQAAQKSILIEAGNQHYFEQPTLKNSYFRLGFTAIEKSKIPLGIQKLADLITL